MPLNKAADVSKNNPCEEEMVETIKRIIAILNKNSIPYWLTGGALLGLIRDGKFVPWDDDIEIGLWLSSGREVENCFPEFQKQGLDVRSIRPDKIGLELHRDPSQKSSFFRGARLVLFRQINGKAARGRIHQQNVIGSVLIMLMNKCAHIHQTHKNKSDAPKKIFSFLPDKLLITMGNSLELLYCKLGCNARFAHEIPFEYFESFRKEIYYDIELTVPVRAEEYLEYRYGPSWKVPARTWIDRANINKTVERL